MEVMVTEQITKVKENPEQEDCVTELGILSIIIKITILYAIVMLQKTAKLKVKYDDTQKM